MTNFHEDNSSDDNAITINFFMKINLNQPKMVWDEVMTKMK